MKTIKHIGHKCNMLTHLYNPLHFSCSCSRRGECVRRRFSSVWELILIRLPPGVAQVIINIHWKRPNLPFTTASSTSLIIAGFLAILQLSSLQSSDAGEYLCQASYSLGGYTSPLVNDSFTLEVSTGKQKISINHPVHYNSPNRVN